MDTQNRNDAILERRYTSFLVSMLDLGGVHFPIWHSTWWLQNARSSVRRFPFFAPCCCFKAATESWPLQCSLIGWFPTVEVPIFLSQRTTFGISLDDIREGFWGRDILGPLCLFLGLGGNNLTEIYTSSYNHGSVLKMGPSNRIVSFQTGREKFHWTMMGRKK